MLDLERPSGSGIAALKMEIELLSSRHIEASITIGSGCRRYLSATDITTPVIYFTTVFQKMSDQGCKPNTTAMLVNLNNEDFNQRLVRVIEATRVNTGRCIVEFIDDKKQVSVKTENLHYLSPDDVHTIRDAFATSLSTKDGAPDSMVTTADGMATTAPPSRGGSRKRRKSTRYKKLSRRTISRKGSRKRRKSTRYKKLSRRTISRKVRRTRNTRHR